MVAQEATRSGSIVKVSKIGPVVILASGPSLTLDDVEYVKGKAFVIAVNDTIRLAPWADVLYSSDKGWWLRHYKAMRSFPGLKVRVHTGQDIPTNKPMPGKHCMNCKLRLKADGTCWCEGIVTLKNGGFTGLSLEQDTLCTGHNSGTAAINLAVLLGATKVVLLGYDMGTHEGKRHFFDTHPQTCSSPFYKFRKLTATLVKPLKEAGIEVVNCSRRTALECFPTKPLREAI